MIIFDFSGVDIKYSLDKPRLYRFHLKVEAQALLFSPAVQRVDKYEVGSNCLTRNQISLEVICVVLNAIVNMLKRVQLMN